MKDRISKNLTIVLIASTALVLGTIPVNIDSSFALYYDIRNEINTGIYTELEKFGSAFGVIDGIDHQPEPRGNLIGIIFIGVGIVKVLSIIPVVIGFCSEFTVC